jgi:hypothetical protein
MLRRIVPLKSTDISGALAATIIRAMMMKAEINSEKLANFYDTSLRNIPEDSNHY